MVEEEEEEEAVTCIENDKNHSEPMHVAAVDGEENEGSSSGDEDGDGGGLDGGDDKEDDLEDHSSNSGTYLGLTKI